MAYKVAVRQGTSPHIKAVQGTPVRRKESPKQTNEPEIALLPQLGGPQEHKPTQP